MAKQLQRLVQHSIATLDKVNEQVLSVANAESFSADAKATRAKLNVVVSVTVPGALRKATSALGALETAIAEETEPRFRRAGMAIGLFRGTLFPSVKRNLGHFFSGKMTRASLVALSKKFSQATITIRRILEGATE